MTVAIRRKERKTYYEGKKKGKDRGIVGYNRLAVWFYYVVSVVVVIRDGC